MDNLIIIFQEQLFRMQKLENTVLTSMATFCRAMASSSSPYMSVLFIPSPQNIVNAYEMLKIPSNSKLIQSFLIFKHFT